MHEAGLGPDDFGEMRQEGDDVVLGHGFDLVDAGHVEHGVAALFPDPGGGRLRHHAQVRPGIGGMRLDLEPDAEAGLRAPRSAVISGRL